MALRFKRQSRNRADGNTILAMSGKRETQGYIAKRYNKSLAALMDADAIQLVGCIDTVRADSYMATIAIYKRCDLWGEKEEELFSEFLKIK